MAEPLPIELSTSEPKRHDVETFITLHEAAAKLGLKYVRLQRAARDGLIPTYSFHNRRKLVRLSEVVAVIEASRSEAGR